jgi:hypothetical protein
VTLNQLIMAGALFMLLVGLPWMFVELVDRGFPRRAQPRGTGVCETCGGFLCRCDSDTTARREV